MRKWEWDYSKIMVTIVAPVLLLLVVGFVIFVCYEMHRQNDLSPVAYIGGGILAALTLIIKFYFKRAEAKSLSDLEWEKTKRLTLFHEKHPEYFTQGEVENDTTYEEDLGGNG